MRKLLFLSVVLAALVVACENKNPVGPEGVGPGGVIVTQTTTSTTSTTSTTTTTVLGNLSRRYIAFQAPANVPSDMTLFFKLLTPQSLLAAIAERLPFVGGGPEAPDADNEYQVTGVYIMKNGTNGTVTGKLGGAPNPLETGGVFQGTLTAKVNSCVAEREFSGRLEPETFSWTGGAVLADCPGGPLAFPSITMLKGDAPLPTTTMPPTTTTMPTTTTTSTTSTAVVCGYSLSATSVAFPSTKTYGEVIVVTQATCPWTADSFAEWITVTPAKGSGPGKVSFVAAANSGAYRTGTLVIAGIQYTVNQVAAGTP